MNRVLILLLVCAAPAGAFGQDTSSYRTSGRVAVGPQLVTNSTNSAKLTEYRDLRDNRFPLELELDALRPGGLYFGLKGDNVTRRDQHVGLMVGDIGRWRLDLSWSELPHTLSNKAMSPYVETSPGKLDVSQVVAMPLKRLALTAAQLPQVLQSDTLIAAYAAAFVRPIDLGTRTRQGTLGVRYTGVEGLDVSAGYTLRTKTGQHLSYGPIGDRPPRTLNIQLAEPVDYRTGDVRMAAEYDFGSYQARAEYLRSDFRNDIEALVWRNVYASPASGSDIDTWDRLVSAYGRRALPPDNSYQNATFSGGASLPRESRLTASVSFGRLRQNQALLPYSYAAVTTPVLTLPRATADARMNTLNVSAEYAIVPRKNLNVRAFFRRFDLDNETPSSQWQYVTDDVANLAGTVTHLNKRVNEPIAWNRQNAGLDATWRLGRVKSTVGLGLEREDIGRHRREAEATAENVLRASWRVQPMPWFSLRSKVLRGVRDGGVYNWRVPRESYWYTQAEAGTDNNNPRYTFENHPDMRRFDLSDRTRDQVDVAVGVTPLGGRLSVSATFRYRQDDFDSEVTPEQPLRGRALADSLAATPGDQLGLLASQRRQFGLDALYLPVDRLSLNAAIGWDAGDAKQRGLEFNENNKQNPSAVATSSLGPWTRAGSQWTARSDDDTRYVGGGASFDIRPNVSLSGSYTYSRSNLDIEYAGFGLTNFDGTPLSSNNEFAFSNPPAVTHRSHVADMRLEFTLPRGMTMRVGYTYDDYRVRDWQQGTASPQFESVNTELLLRDTSRSVQWGNRLFNMGSYLAPGYTAHIVHVSLAYHF